MLRLKEESRVAKCRVTAVTWNSPDETALSMRELSTTILKLKAQHGPPLKAIKLSRLTLLMLPLVLTQQSISTFYGVPIVIDDSLEPWEFQEVYD